MEWPWRTRKYIISIIPECRKFNEIDFALFGLEHSTLWDMSGQKVQNYDCCNFVGSLEWHQGYAGDPHNCVQNGTDAS